MPSMKYTGWAAGGMVLIGVMTLAVGCGNDGHPFRPTSEPESWEQVNPFPASNDLRGICGDGNGGLFVVGAVGTALHLGQTHRSVGVFPDETILWDVCASGPDDAWACSIWPGNLYHYDGRSWTLHTEFSEIRGMWSCGPGRLFAMGAFDIYEFDGTFWTNHTYPVPPCPGPNACMNPYLNGIWGAGVDDVYAVGSGGFMIHHDGVSWDIVDCGTSVTLNEVWGSGPDDVFAIGDEGTIIRYDGLAWEPQVSGTTESLIDIWGSGPADVYVLGADNMVLHFDGDIWSPIPVDTEIQLYGIGGTGPGAVYVIGDAGTLLYLAGTSWVPYNDDPRQNFMDIWGCSETDMWLAGGDGVSRFDGLTVGDTEPLPIARLWGSARDDVIGVGVGVFRFDGASWKAESIPPVDTLTAVWGRSATDIFTVGYEGTVLRYDGNVWQQQPTPVEMRLMGVWGSPDPDGDVFAVGQAGVILRRANAVWSVEEAGTEADLYCVWGTSATNVYVGGLNVLFHYDGTSWTQLENPDGPRDHFYLSIWGRDATDIFVGGLGLFPQEIVQLRGFSLHFDGADWTPERTGTQQPITRIWGHEGGTVYAVGGDGEILKRVSGAR